MRKRLGSPIPEIDSDCTRRSSVTHIQLHQSRRKQLELNSQIKRHHVNENAPSGVNRLLTQSRRCAGPASHRSPDRVTQPHLPSAGSEKGYSAPPPSQRRQHHHPTAFSLQLQTSSPCRPIKLMFPRWPRALLQRTSPRDPPSRPRKRPPNPTRTPASR